MTTKPETTEVVTLKDGTTDVPKVLVQVTMMSLRKLMQEEPIAFYELVMVCRDRNHQPFGNAGEKLEELSLLQNGTVHDAIRHITLSATEGEGLDLRLVSPLPE